MRTAPTSLLLVHLLVGSATTIAGQDRPPITELGPTAARSVETFRIVSGIRALPGGRLLVNDMGSRRLLLLDSTLAVVAVVADSVAGSRNPYGQRLGALVAYRGDSSYFIDPTSLSMLLLDPSGSAVRTVAVPRAQDVASMMMIGTVGGGAFDAKGRLVYRGSNLPAAGAMAAMFSPSGAAMPTFPDSAPIVRTDMATRALDTVAFLKVPTAGRMSMTRGTDGKMTISAEVNPLPVTDDWAVTSDGSIAIVRGRDYHIDWLGADGTWRSSPKLPYEWQRLTDEDKVAFIDTLRVARERLLATQAGAAGALAGGMLSNAGMTMNIGYVSPSELPDYRPPFFTGAVKADADGNVWILPTPTRKVPGGAVYDVVDPRGALAARVQVPAGRSVVGFAPGGVVYLLAKEGEAYHLERARRR